MGKKTFEQNWADKSLTVHSLKVLKDLNSPGIKKIQQSVESLQTQNQKLQLEQNNYWSDLASDGTITPYEKKILLKQFEEIKQSYVALLNQATSQNLQNTAYFIDYQTVYNNLRSYLYTTLKLFDDMDINTVITDREAFNAYFSSYYYDEKFVVIALTTGIMGNLGFRVLANLNESGTEGEIGLYHGTIYQYTGGKWVAVGLEGYMGAINTLPSATLNQYFLASEDFLATLPLYVNDEPLYVNDEPLYIGVGGFEEGFIYVCNEDGVWEKITDTSDYRYVVAMVDLISITGQLPGAFQDAIDASAESLKAELEEEIANIQLPGYLGVASAPPSNANEGDFFVYSGNESGNWHNSGVYKYIEGVWTYLEPESNSDYYMRCLDDVLSLNNVTSGYFAEIFARVFWAHSITTDKLSTRVLYLRAGGYIRSENTGYVAGVQGLQIDYNGNIDANQNTHIGGNCTIDGTLGVGGTANFTGVVNLGSGTRIVGGEIRSEDFDMEHDKGYRLYSNGSTGIAEIPLFICNTIRVSESYNPLVVGGSGVKANSVQSNTGWITNWGSLLSAVNIYIPYLQGKERVTGFIHVDGYIDGIAIWRIQIVINSSGGWCWCYGWHPINGFTDFQITWNREDGLPTNPIKILV